MQGRTRATLLSLQRWARCPEPETFPLDAVVAEFRRVGKHFVDPTLLEALATVRADLPAGDGPLRRFLDTALDKYDGRFDNPSYLAIHDLPLPAMTWQKPLSAETLRASRQRDRLIMLLVADLLRFELDALDGATDLLPRMRPDRRVVAKRCALGMRALRPAMMRLGIEASEDLEDPIATARVLVAQVESERTDEERRMLAVTMLTVWTAHDEHLFVRILQAYETTFTLVAVQLQAAIVAARTRDTVRTSRALRAAEKAMREAKPLFSLVATMKPEAFLAFREYTDGASAIQSRSYKTVESLCRRPSPERLGGPGYDATPEVRERVVAGRATVQEAVAQCPDRTGEVRAAMEAFEASVLAWRRTHFNFAVKVLGNKRGTGYTAGVPYLAQHKDTPLFDRDDAALPAAA
jgi:tryptophan 2,3-dioxygenase